MTRQERLDALAKACTTAHRMGLAVCNLLDQGEIEIIGDSVVSAQMAGQGANRALDHLAALEQQAVQDYLADVPLPEGWTEEDARYPCGPGSGAMYYHDDGGVCRAFATHDGVHVNSTPAHWPAIPRAVLVRAAVQCSRLREAGRS